MKEELDELLEWARDYSMTEEDKAEQAVSFAYGNCAIENHLITRELVRDAKKEWTACRNSDLKWAGNAPWRPQGSSNYQLSCAPHAAADHLTEADAQ